MTTNQMTLRRLRQNQHIRDLTQDVQVSRKDFIQPLFVVEGLKQREAITGLHGIYRETPQSLLQQVERDLAVGIAKFILFIIPKEKGLKGFSYEFASEQIKALKAIGIKFHEKTYKSKNGLKFKYSGPINEDIRELCL